MRADIQVSVIVPIYNSEKTLGHCIDSILSQTFRDFELLLIDDGSTDSSTAICDEYAAKDNRVRVFHKGNGGVSSARNIGLDNAAGKWVTFCDSDDYVNDNWLSLFVRNCKNNVGMVVQTFEYSNKKDYDYFEGNAVGFIEKFHDSNFIGYVWNKIFLLEIIRNHNVCYNESFTFLEDEVFVYEYLQYIDKVVFIPEVAYHYNIPDFSKKYTGNNFNPNYAIFRTLERINTNRGISNKPLVFYINKLYRSLFDSFLKKDPECRNQLIAYRNIIKSCPFAINVFPLIYRIVLKSNYEISFQLLKLMSHIRRCY